MKVYIVLAAVAASLVPFAIRAQEVTTLQVQATVAESCEVTTTPVDFGSVNLLAATAHDATGTISVTCTNGAPYSIALNEGLAAGATVTTRQMAHQDGGTGTLAYGLFSDAAHSANWGDTDGLVTGTGTGTVEAHNVYAQIPAGQTSVGAGSYADTVTVTVTY